MKKKDLSNLREKKQSELVELVEDKKNELTGTHAKVVAGQEKDLKKVKGLRKDIAQILTILREMDISEAKKGKEKTETS